MLLTFAIADAPDPAPREGAKVRSIAEGPPDAELVPRVARGDAWASRVIYRRHVGIAMQTALRTLRNRAEAEDVVQDAFMLAFSRLDQLRDPGAFRRWLVRIVVSNVHRRLRRQRVEPLDGLDAEAAPTASPAVRAELRLLDEVLSQVDDRDRIAWVLRYVLGHKLEEVADACDCSLSTAKRRVQAAHALVERHVSVGVLDE